METKKDFHRLIDTIADEQTLEAYYQLIKRLSKAQEGTLWNSLSISEREELLISYDDSFVADNLITHDQVKEQHTKWLNG